MRNTNQQLKISWIRLWLNSIIVIFICSCSVKNDQKEDSLSDIDWNQSFNVESMNLSFCILYADCVNVSIEDYPRNVCYIMVRNNNDSLIGLKFKNKDFSVYKKTEKFHPYIASRDSTFEPFETKEIPLICLEGEYILNKNGQLNDSVSILYKNDLLPVCIK